MPTLIYNVTDLQNIQNDLAGEYELANDIDASETATWNPTTDRGAWQPSTAYNVHDYVRAEEFGTEWDFICIQAHTSGSSFSSINWARVYYKPSHVGFIPIGGKEKIWPNWFEESLDGKGFRIINLYVTRPYGYAGLFRSLANGADIRNLQMVNPTITGWDNVGTLAGISQDSDISDVHISGTSVKGSDWAGGFAGQLYLDRVARCSVTGTFEFSDAAYQYTVGGFVGYNHGILDECWANVDVTTFDDPATEEIGGFVGLNTNVIRNCYARGNVIGHHQVGGFVGYHRYEDGLLENCYSTGLVTGVTSAGGFCGDFEDTEASITACFWDTQTSGLTTSDGGTGKTTAEMKQIATFSAWDIATSPVPRNDGYPFLSWEIGSSPIWLLSGDSPRKTVPILDIITLEAIRNIEMSAMGRFWVDEEGKAHWDSRYARSP